LDRVEVVVIGAGVVGLAIGRALALAGREVLVLERERHFGTGTSSRNSEVIHAGLYYPTGSLKARLCVEGRRQLYAYCADRGVEHKRLGKLIVATRGEQIEALKSIHRRALANGVENCTLISAAESQRMEPQLACVAALHSRETGIVDSHGLMLALLGDLEAAGGTLACAAPFERAQPSGSGWVVHTGGDAPFELAADWLVNAAGLHAQDVAAHIEPLDAAHIPRRFLARGCYFQLSGRAPFSRLIYPVPVPGGLGVHLTLDLGGQARFGPDVEWIEAIDYTVDPRRADAFYAEVREYWPQLPDDSLAPAYAGIRPKLAGPGGPATDFVIAGPREHSVPGLVNLFGIESPGLTACLAIGTQVARLISDARSAVDGVAGRG
jgi:L-2-hydroxyglutarate oxidase LhgO